MASHPTFPMIAEVKLSTPVDGRISSASPSHLVSSYLAGGAAALSVLTEPTRFAGELRHLLACEDADVPVLMKDFVVDERQVRAASRFKADAVLLIQEIFSDRPDLDRDGLIDLAHFLGLEVVLEAHSEPEMRLAHGERGRPVGHQPARPAHHAGGPGDGAAPAALGDNVRTTGHSDERHLRTGGGGPPQEGRGERGADGEVPLRSGGPDRRA